MSESVVFERSGGFIGMNQRLQLTSGALEAQDLKTRASKARALTAGEQARLASLLEQVRGLEAPTGSATGVADAFVLKLTLPARGTLRFHTLGVPVGKGDGTPWGDLFSFLDGLLEKALAAQDRGVFQL